jgi:hypothetical protein
MVPAVRRQFNQEFTQHKYEAFLNELAEINGGELDFRIAETPVFIPKEFAKQALDACESIIDAITKPEYLQQSERAIPEHLRVRNEDSFPHFIAFDFGICKNEKGEIEPQLIEMQGFPSLFAFQILLPEISSKYFNYPDNYSIYLNGFNKESYLALLRKIIVGDENPKHVILLEVFPEKQKTKIDFYCTEKYLGIKPVCLTDLIQEGRELFYMNDGVKTKVKRIYNRLIFDDLFQQPKEVQEKGKLFQQDLDVTWVPHPNWFYRISKFTLPFINHPNVPQTWFLADVKSLPEDLENYVVKPLFSFAGQGVIIDVTKEDIDKIEDKENWILQRKVNYAAVIETPDEPAKAEIRIFYFWDKDAARPIATNNLARLSKGKMVGVRYNKDKSWVGGSFCLFEQ